MLGHEYLLFAAGVLLPVVHAEGFMMYRDTGCGNKKAKFRLDYGTDHANNNTGPRKMWGWNPNGVDPHPTFEHIGSVKLDQLCAFRWNENNPEWLWKRFWTDTDEEGKFTRFFGEDSPDYEKYKDFGKMVQWPAELAHKDDPTCFPLNQDLLDDDGNEVHVDQIFYFDDTDKARVFCPNDLDPPKVTPTSYPPGYGQTTALPLSAITSVRGPQSSA